MRGRIELNFDELNTKAKAEYNLLDKTGKPVRYSFYNDDFDPESQDKDSFIIFDRLDYALLEGEFVQNSQPEGGWKFHISLDEDPENLKKAWNIIKDILIDYRVASAKILKKDAELDFISQGKEITIYACADPQKSLKEWQKILTRITEEFVANNIKPGYRCYGDDIVPGSSYITYRNDAIPGMPFEGITEMTALYLPNPFLIEGVYENLAIRVGGQPNPPLRDNSAKISGDETFGSFDQDYQEIREQMQDIKKVLTDIQHLMPLQLFMLYRRDRRQKLHEIYRSKDEVGQKLISMISLQEELNEKFSELKAASIRAGQAAPQQHSPSSFASSTAELAERGIMDKSPHHPIREQTKVVSSSPSLIPKAPESESLEPSLSSSEEGSSEGSSEGDEQTSGKGSKNT